MSPSSTTIPVAFVNRLAGKNGPLLLVCVPVLLAVVFHGLGSRQRELTTRREQPSLVFNQYLVNLGTVPPDEYVHARFVFQNKGTRPVTVSDLKPSCGCLNPRLEKRIYEPGESGEFFVRVSTANEQPGPQEYFVDVNYNDGQPRTTRTTFKVTLPKLSVTVAPKAIIFYQLSEGETTREVVVTDRRNRTLTPLDVGCEPMLAKAKTSDINDLGDGRRELRLKVTVSGKAAPGRQHAMITMTTDDPVFPVIRVPVIIEGASSTPLAKAGNVDRPSDEASRQ